MIKLLPTLIAPALLFSACSNDRGKPQDLTNIPTLEITATHAIAIDQSADNISFVPNNVAPWLGHIILQNADGSLSSTDIEGRSTQSISNNSYSDLFGLARENASGVFLAINNKNKNIEAFVESDDKGNFEPLSYSGDSLSPDAFCNTDRSSQSSVSILTPDDKITKLTLSISTGENAKSAPIEQDIGVSLAALKDSKFCASTDNQIFAYTNTRDKIAFLHTLTENNTQTAQTNFLNNISSMAPIELNGTQYLLLLQGENVLLHNISTLRIDHRLLVKSGLSIGGLDKTKFIASTAHNFGGAAFSEGLVAFGQADDDRIVFVSRSYLASVVEEQKS